MSHVRAPPDLQAGAGGGAGSAAEPTTGANSAAAPSSSARLRPATRCPRLCVGADSMDVLMRPSDDGREDERVGTVVRTFRATPTSGRAIRAFVREALHVADVSDEVAADVELVVSELATNAIEHGTGDELTVEVDVARPQWLQVSITCVSEAAPALRAWRTWAIAPPDARSGRGLGIVRRLMDDVHVESRDGRMTVRCRRRVRQTERR